MQKILLIALLTFAMPVFAGGDFATNWPEVFVKNFACSSGVAKFNVVNKSSKNIGSVTINIFDDAGDPIDQKTIYSVYIGPMSGKEISKDYIDCSKIKRVGFSISQY
jgi:hypothetical protein